MLHDSQVAHLPSTDVFSIAILPDLQQKGSDRDSGVYDQPGMGDFQFVALASPVACSIEVAHFSYAHNDLA